MKLLKVVMLVAFSLVAAQAKAVQMSKSEFPNGHILCQSGNASKADVGSSQALAESGKAEKVNTQDAQ